ncbi:C-C chemokine receptor type 8 isoform X1 [Phycodurus eques]|uniref:C-C chemokine receptor type 8 isoform X1 n=1 Tax=Phycodurus eques TaxID=693459 RepID=UPI002ACE58A9|nr:C-C chemokine receptor type 8 isoform X1 [Phycodurus eques]XP_061531833.1 C-C chemokine receptor type 8 isoform X1 [Phycodurus eques]XP_061531834.1 C-C chemokine receptor type 8 isoform X1 [Phycodurus eques]
MEATKNETWIYLDMYEYEYYDANSSHRGDESPQLSKEFTATRTVLCILFFLGLLGNATVLWILQRHIKLKTLTDICLLNLALSDLSLAVSLFLWAYDSQDLAVCKVTTGVYQLGFYSGTSFVTLLSVDRYLAIVHAAAATRTRTLGHGLAAGVVVWVVSVVMATPQVIFASVAVSDSSSLSCKPVYPEESQRFWKMLRNFSENTVSLFLCLPIQIFCYVKILHVLSKTRISKKDRAVKLIFTVVCVFVVCWVPYNVVVFLQTLQLFEMFNTYKASTAINSATAWSEIIALSHCCVNPVIYALVGEKFRKPLGNLLSRHCYKRRASVSHGDNSEIETSNTALRSQI